MQAQPAHLCDIRTAYFGLNLPTITLLQMLGILLLAHNTPSVAACFASLPCMSTRQGMTVVLKPAATVALVVTQLTA